MFKCFSQLFSKGNEKISSQVIASEISSRITLLRFPLILLVIGVHARYSDHLVVENAGSFLNFPFFVYFPNVAVSVFFCISGYLLAWQHAADTKINYGELLQKKIERLVIPYIFWNLFYFLLFYLAIKVLSGSSFAPNDRYAGIGGLSTFFYVFGLDLTSFPMDVPLWFVRELIIYFAFAPLLLKFVFKIKWPVLLLCGVFASVIIPIFSGLGYFLIGMTWGRYKYPGTEYFKRNAWFFVGAWGLLAVLSGVWFNWNIFILSAFPIFFMMGDWLEKCPEKIKKILSRLGNDSFWIYCMHSPISTNLGRVFRKLDYFHIPQELCYLINIVLTTIICLIALWGLRKICMPLGEILSGVKEEKKKILQPINLK
ncbi:MAG: acyltransferase [Lentisphaeria bacterium]